MAWPTTSPASRGYGPAWKKLRLTILERDQHQCECGQPAGIVDHRIAKSAGGTDHPDNLRAICQRCHQAKTRVETTAAVKAKPPKQRPREAHPVRLKGGGGSPPPPPERHRPVL